MLNFVPNGEKPKWKLTEILTCIGISVNLNKGCLYISEERISKQLTTSAGKIIAIKFALGNVAQLR